MALASAIALEGNPGGTVVTDSITSDGLKEYIETTLGGQHHRFKRGYKNVINEALRLNQEGVNCPWPLRPAATPPCGRTTSWMTAPI